MVLVVILNSIINITIMKNKTLATAAMAACVVTLFSLCASVCGAAH